jgi:hypothetical protein
MLGTSRSTGVGKKKMGEERAMGVGGSRRTRRREKALGWSVFWLRSMLMMLEGGEVRCQVGGGDLESFGVKSRDTLEGEYEGMVREGGKGWKDGGEQI